MALIAFLLLHPSAGRCICTDLPLPKPQRVLQGCERVTPHGSRPLAARVCAGTQRAIGKGDEHPIFFQSPTLMPRTDLVYLAVTAQVDLFF